MPAASLFEAFDAAYNRKGCEILTSLKADGLSLDQMCDEIAETIGWSPGRETLRRWLADDGFCA